MRIAVVGSGISSLSAAWSLAPDHELHLFESAAVPGGHAHTVDVEDNGPSFPIDLGFIVYNDLNYPLFTRLLKELEVATAPSSMGFSVSSPKTGIEYSGESLTSLLASPRNATRPEFWSMIRGFHRFCQAGREALARGQQHSLAEFCRAARLSEAFRHLFLRPMAGAIWSLPRGEVDRLPAATLLRFFEQHGLLTVRGRPAWRTVAGGSRTYVAALLGKLPAELHLNSMVEHVERTAGGVELRIAGERARFDHVVFGVHSDQALALLAEPTTDERSILGAIRYRANDIVLHTDRSILPRSPRVWSSWNVSVDGQENEPIAVTYLMNKLQPLPTKTPWCVTLNRTDAIDPTTIRKRLTMAHPQFDAAAIAAQARWHSISGAGRTHYCGAYWRYGFHEDGMWSGARVGEALATVREDVA